MAHLRHPHIVEVIDFGEQNGLEYLVLEFLDGRELTAAIEKGPMRWERAVAIARQIALALAGAHRIGVVHRDLKPGNIMLIDLPGRPDHIKVLDFGIAKIVDPRGGMAAEMESLTQAGVALGTPNYMAPEMWREEKVDGRADLYALGILLFEMLTGRPPFHAPTTFEVMGRHLNAEIPPLAPVRAGSNPPEELEELIRSMLAKDKEDRPARAEDIIGLLDIGYRTGQFPINAADSQETVGPGSIRPRSPRSLDGPNASGPIDLRALGAGAGGRRMPVAAGAVIAALAGIGVWEMWGDQGKAMVRALVEDNGLEEMLTSPASAGASTALPAVAIQAHTRAAAAELPTPQEKVLPPPGLEMVSDPSAAEVLFNGQSLGRTPLNATPGATATQLLD